MNTKSNNSFSTRTVMQKTIKIAVKQIRWSGVVFSLTFFILFIACSQKKIVVPPITNTPTAEYHVGKFVWMDLLTDKVLEVKKFYGELLGWEFEGEDKADAPYTLIKFKDQPIGGIVYADRALFWCYLKRLGETRPIISPKSMNGYGTNY
ncbi:MAG: hypothetical protein P8048_14245 [Calditrichia bacterium]